MDRQIIEKPNGHSLRELFQSAPKPLQERALFWHVASRKDNHKLIQFLMDGKEEYYAEAALWMGLPPGELEEVFPNLDRFYTHSPTTPPLGFLL